MTIALLALAFAMILGGLLAAFFGWDIVLVERGWTMVIAGSISAAGGAVLLGLAAAVSKLSRIHRELAHLQDRLGDAAPAAPRASTDLSSAALAGGLAGGALGGADAPDRPEAPDLFSPVVTDGRPEPDEEPEERPGQPEPAASVEPPLPFPSRAASQPAPALDDIDHEAKVPDFLLGDRQQDTYEDARTADADASLYAGEPDETHGREARADSAAVTPAAWPEEPVEPPVEAPAEDTASPAEDVSPEEAQEPVIVGTYNSGDNKYVMFSDGSIEAQTPGGVFRFKSLDELKEFIASGGEGSSAA
jgi:hypothetical protein